MDHPIPKIKENRKAHALIALFLGILGFSYFFIYGHWRSQTILPHLQTLPIVKFADGNVPCLEVEIEGKEFAFLFDLGFEGEASMNKESLQNIVDKTFLKPSHSFGFRGNSYLENIYRVPAIKLGRVTIHNPTIAEENPQFNKDSIIVPAKNPETSSGKLGCNLFKKCSLFLDLGHSELIMCDNIETFKEQGHSLDGFAQAPLLYDNNLIECEVSTPNGPLRCLIDTGFTVNVLHADDMGNEPVENLIRNEKHHVKFSHVQIGGKEMGEMILRKIPIKLPFKIEAILGMEFLFKHQVFIDFQNRHLYFSPSLESASDTHLGKRGHREDSGFLEPIAFCSEDKIIRREAIDFVCPHF